MAGSAARSAALEEYYQAFFPRDSTASAAPFVTYYGIDPATKALRLMPGGPELLAEATELLTGIFQEAGHEMADLEKVSPQWTGIDNPDGLTKGMVFKTNTSLYVTAQSASS